MQKLNYNLVSMAVVLRDTTKPEYASKEHEMLVDIADTMWNADIPSDMLKPEYKALYDDYNTGEFWGDVFADIKALESQVDGHEQELLEEYKECLEDDRPTYYAEDVKKMLKDGVITAKELEEMDPIII